MRPWIKFNITLFTDPRVDAIASAIAAHAARYIMDAQHAKDLFGVTESVTCHALRDVTVTALLRIFIAGNEHTTDGIFRHVSSIAYLDLLAGIAGMGAAMQKVGWALFDKAAQTVTLVNFLEYNSPGKNGQRTVSKEAERKRKERERKRQAEDLSAVEDERTKRDMSRGQERDSHVTPSISISISESESNSESESESQIQTGTTDNPRPATVHGTLDAHRSRIDALRPAWKKMPAWSYEDNAALLEALPNLDALEPKDWLILTHYMKWANSTANQGRDAHKVTSRRHLFLTELPSYLDRATAHWKQAGSPRLDDATKPAAAAKPKAPPAPEHVPTGPTDVFKQLAHDLKIPARAESPPPASPTPSRTLPPS